MASCLLICLSGSDLRVRQGTDWCHYIGWQRRHCDVGFALLEPGSSLPRVDLSIALPVASDYGITDGDTGPAGGQT